MGRRSRRRDAADAGASTRPSGVGQTARVSVDDATWREFRDAIGDRSIAEALGALVEGQVAQWHRRRVERADLSDAELVAALERAQALTETLRRLTWRLEAHLQRPSQPGPRGLL